MPGEIPCAVRAHPTAARVALHPVRKGDIGGRRDRRPAGPVVFVSIGFIPRDASFSFFLCRIPPCLRIQCLGQYQSSPDTERSCAAESSQPQHDDEVEHSVSRAGVLSELRAFFAYFVTTGLLKSNPTNGFRVKKPKKQPPTTLDEEQLTAILTAAYLGYRRVEQAAPRRGLPRCLRWLAARDWAIVSLLITSGIRTKEIMSLHADAVDLQSRLIRISGKGDQAHTVRQRIIPLSEPFTPVSYTHLTLPTKRIV